MVTCPMKMASLSSYWEGLNNCSLAICPNFTKNYDDCHGILDVGFTNGDSGLVSSGFVLAWCSHGFFFIICTFPLLEQTSGSDAIAGLRLVASLLRYVLNIITLRIGLVKLGHL